MPTIYRRTKHIHEMNGRVLNGLAAVVHSPNEVLALEGLVESAARLPGDPLANMYRVLNNADESAEAWPWAEDIPPESLAAASDESRDGLDARTRSLRVSLALARTMWRQQRDDVENLSLALVLPRPGRRAAIASK